MTRITSQHRERATCSPLSPSFPLSLNSPSRKGTYRFTSTDPTPRDSLPVPRRGTPCTHDIRNALYIYSAIAAGIRRDRGEAASLRWYTELRACSFSVHHVRALVAQAERRKNRDKKKNRKRGETGERERERKLRSRILDRLIRARDRNIHAYTRVAELRDHRDTSSSVTQGRRICQGRMCGCFKRQLRRVTPAGVYALSRDRAHVYALVSARSTRHCSLYTCVACVCVWEIEKEEEIEKVSRYIAEINEIVFSKSSRLLRFFLPSF